MAGRGGTKDFGEGMKCFCEGALGPPECSGAIRSIGPHRNVIEVENRSPQVQSLGLKSKASLSLGECERKERQCLLGLRTGSRSPFPGPFYFLDCGERDPEGGRTAPTHRQGP